MNLHEKVAASTLKSLSCSVRERFLDGIIQVKKNALKGSFRCDCGQDFDVWMDDLKGKDRVILSDCGCGIWAKMQAEKQAKNEVKWVQERSRIMAPENGARKRRNSTTMTFYLDLNIVNALYDYADLKGWSMSKAAAHLLSLGLAVKE